MLAGKPITRFRSSKVQGLLVYLALQSQRAVPRDVLSALFWPDEPDSVARTNLRQSFYQLRKVLDDRDDAERPFLLINRQTAQFNPQSDYQLDVQLFRTAVSNGDLATAVSHFRGDLLPGFTCDSLDFEEWLRVEREQLHRQGLEALTNLAEEQLRRGDFAKAQTIAQRQLALEPWRENAHRQLMQALALSGDRSAALAQFDRCYEMLEAELGVEPTDETVALYEQIATGIIVPVIEEVGLPQPPTTFVGRIAEIGHIIQTLNKSDCRVLTLSGAGGVGKTRLAVQVAQTFIEQTGSQAYFASLLGVTNAAQAIAAIGLAMGLPLLDARHAGRQINEKLNGETALLVLDNAEPVLANDGQAFIELINTISVATAVLRILVTSRYALQARQEWTLPVQGLTVPTSVEKLTANNWGQYDAIALFQQRARQADVTFTLSQQNIAEVAQLCQLCDGLPLAIELAAAQTRQFAVAEILSAVTQDLKNLRADLRDLPPRHRSLTAVYAQSWELLNETEQQALMATAVFRGGFSRAAARAVLEGKADQLPSLSEKSLLIRTRTPEGLTQVRYGQSPLLQAFLSEMHPPGTEVRDRHAAYFLNWAVSHLRQMKAEQANVAAAWTWARERESVTIPRRWDPACLEEVLDEVVLPVVAPEGVKTAVLIGRDAEMAQLRQAVRPVLQANQNGGLTTITGEAGIGKSHLITQLQAEAAASIWFDCPCDETMTQALHPFRHWLRYYFGQGVHLQGDETVFAIRFDDLVQATADKALQTELTENRSFLAALVDIILPDSAYTRLRPEQRREHFQQAIKALIKAESLLQPVILHVEDAHWLDAESRALLENLLRNVAEFPFVVVVSARPAGFEPLVLLDLPQHSIKLEPFTAVAIAQLAAHHLSAQPSNELVELLRERGGGNPFYTEQILLYLRENGFVTKGKLVRSHYAALDTLLPPDIHNLLVARLSQLEPAVYDVVTQAAVLGHEFSLTALRQIVDDDLLQNGLANGAKSAIWQPVSADRYVFNHALLRDAAYDTLFEQRRQDYHQQAARAVTAVATPSQPQFATIARHYDEANQPQKAVHNYLKAGDEARDNYFVQEAHAHYSRGLALAQTDKQRLPMLLGREAVNHWLGNREEQRTDLHELTTLAASSGDKLLQAAVGLRHAKFALATGDYAQAIRHAQRTTSLAVSLDDRALEAKAMHRWGRAVWQQGSPESAAPLLERALKLAQRVKSTYDQAQNLYDLSIINFYRDDYDASRQKLHDALSLFEELDDKRNVIRCINMLGLVASVSGHYEEALRYQDRAVALSRSIDWPFGELHMLGHLGNCYFELGDFVQSREIHAEALTLSRVIGDREAEIISLDTMGLCYYFEGNLLAAKERFDQALAVAQSTKNSRQQAYLKTHLGLTLTSSEEIEQAGVMLYDAYALRNQTNDNRAAIDTKAALAWLDLARGDSEFAVERVQEILAWLSVNGTAGVELPLQVYWQCITILNMAGETAVAATALQAAHTLLQSRAANIQDEDRRRQYLTNVPHHRQIVQAWQRQIT